MHEGEGQVAVLVIPRVYAEEFDNGLKRLVADLNVLTCCDLWVAEEASGRAVENYHSGMV